MFFLTNMVVFVFSDWYYFGRQIHQKTRKKNLSDEKWIIIIKKKGAQTHKAACQRAACWCWWAAAPLFPMWGASLAATVLGKKVGLCVMEHTVTMRISRFDLTHTSHFVRSEFVCIKQSESRNWIQSHRSLSCMWWIFWYPVLMQGLKL